MNQIPIPNKLREARKAAHLTQEQVAKALGFTVPDRISRWEHGLTFPHFNNILKLAALYDADPRELYGDLYKAYKTPKGERTPDLLAWREAFW